MVAVFKHVHDGGTAHARSGHFVIALACFEDSAVSQKNWLGNACSERASHDISKPAAHWVWSLLPAVHEGLGGCSSQ
jgi:hypothetical protein